MARIYCIIGILDMINRSALSKCLITLDAQIDLYIEKESWHQPLMRHRRRSEVPGFKDMRYIYPGAPRPGMKKGARGPSDGPPGGAPGPVPPTGQRRPALPRAAPAVLSARGGLASGFGTGPGVSPLPWPLAGGRRPPAASRDASPRALGAAQRSKGPGRAEEMAWTERAPAAPRGMRP